jgi:hypothetical protein
MRERENVQTLLAVFDLIVPKTFNLREDWSGRVILLYDREKAVKGYTLLSRELPEEVIHRLTLWLEKHGDVDDIARRLGASGRNGEDLLDFSSAS